MNPSTVELLEPRRHLAADLGVSIASTTLPDALIAGVASRPAVARVVVTNTSDDGARFDRSLPSIPLVVSLRSADGAFRNLGTFSASARNLAPNASKTFTVRLRVPTDLPAGTHTLVASATPPTALADANPNNNTANGKTVVAAAPTTDLSIAATVRAKAAVLPTGAPAQVRATITNLGNVTTNATADLEITSTIDGRTEVLSFVKAAKLKIKPGRTFSAKPINVRLIGVPSGDATATLGARLAKPEGLLADQTGNNSVTVGSFTVQPPPQSVFIDARPTSPVILGNTITFKRTSINFNDPNFVFEELGTWVDSNGRTGRYDYRESATGTVRHPLFLISNSGTPFLFGNFSSAVGIGNKTLTFTSTQAGSAGSISALSTTLFYRFGK